jgi:hypothetical protein
LNANEELKARVVALENYLEGIGRALKRKGSVVRDAVRAHEQHVTTARLIRKHLDAD